MNPNEQAPRLATDEETQELVAAMQNGSDALGKIDRLLERYPDDPRLHFMRGSVLIGTQRPIEAHAALSRAVELAPDFDIARFQLGFFQLTSAEADAALATWEPLDRLPAEHYLRVFADGLRCLIRDEFTGAIEHLRRGIALNEENPPLNNDMQLIIAECEAMTAGEPPQPGEKTEAEEVSAVSLVLGRYGFDA